MEYDFLYIANTFGNIVLRIFIVMLLRDIGLSFTFPVVSFPYFFYEANAGQSE